MNGSSPPAPPPSTAFNIWIFRRDVWEIVRAQQAVDDAKAELKRLQHELKQVRMKHADKKSVVLMGKGKGNQNKTNANNDNAEKTVQQTPKKITKRILATPPKTEKVRKLPSKSRK